jgi:hypothetical protein
MSNLYRGPSIDASSQVSLHLAEGFQRRRLKCEKLTDDSQPQVIKLTSCLPMVGGSLRVLQLLPTLKLVTMILLKYS